MAIEPVSLQHNDESFVFLNMTILPFHSEINGRQKCRFRGAVPKSAVRHESFNEIEINAAYTKHFFYITC